jgi:hypothetical protein
MVPTATRSLERTFREIEDDEHVYSLTRGNVELAGEASWILSNLVGETEKLVYGIV